MPLLTYYNQETAPMSQNPSLSGDWGLGMRPYAPILLYRSLVSLLYPVVLLRTKVSRDKYCTLHEWFSGLPFGWPFGSCTKLRWAEQVRMLASQCHCMITPKTFKSCFYTPHACARSKVILHQSVTIKITKLQFQIYWATISADFPPSKHKYVLEIIQVVQLP